MTADYFKGLLTAMALLRIEHQRIMDECSRIKSRSMFFWLFQRHRLEALEAQSDVLFQLACRICEVSSGTEAEPLPSPENSLP
jgi:hypothetical protein